jgi:hypothetical protein
MKKTASTDSFQIIQPPQFIIYPFLDSSSQILHHHDFQSSSHTDPSPRRHPSKASAEGLESNSTQQLRCGSLRMSHVLSMELNMNEGKPIPLNPHEATDKLCNI